MIRLNQELPIHGLYWLHKVPIPLDKTFCLKQTWSVHTIHDGQNQWPTSPFSMLPASTSFLTPLYTTCHCSISLSLFTKVNKLSFFFASQCSEPKSQIMESHKLTRLNISFRPALEFSSVIQGISEFEHWIFKSEIKQKGIIQKNIVLTNYNSKSWIFFV